MRRNSKRQRCGDKLRNIRQKIQKGRSDYPYLKNSEHRYKLSWNLQRLPAFVLDFLSNPRPVRFCSDPRNSLATLDIILRRSVTNCSVLNDTRGLAFTIHPPDKRILAYLIPHISLLLWPSFRPSNQNLLKFFPKAQITRTRLTSPSMTFPSKRSF
jgi:hypothetical protein